MKRSCASRFTKLYDIEEALLLLDDIPSDGDITEESDLDDDYAAVLEPLDITLAELPTDVVSDSEVSADVVLETDNCEIAVGIDQPAATAASSKSTTTTKQQTSRKKSTKQGKKGCGKAKKASLVNTKWSKARTSKKCETFDSPEGPIEEHFAGCNLPCDYFLCYFDESLRNDIIFQSNLYIEQRQRNVPHFDEKELLGFIGINLLMGYHRLPSWQHYWSSDQDISIPFVSSAMPRNRFAQLLSNLHVNDNSSMPNNNQDKLFKLRPMISRLNDNYVKLYNVSKNISIDESMILFKGRSSIKQYNPMKPIKRGYKLWMRADGDGYISKFDVYQGKGDAVSTSDAGNFGLGEKVVISMTSDLYGKGHHVYFDNYFASIPLMEHLAVNSVNACGTIKTKRKEMPADFAADKSLARGEYDYRVTKQGIITFKWMDSKPVHIISNFHGSEAATVKRRQKDGTRVEFHCPEAVKDYNTHMGGVDKADMLCAVYGTNRKAKKWWHRIFFGLIDRTLVNASIAYQKCENTQIPLLDFKRQVAQSLVTMARKPNPGRPRRSPQAGPALKRRKSAWSVSSAIRLVNRGCHWVYFTESRGRCEVCSVQDIESRPKTKCSTCKVYLCCNEKKNCFSAYHDV